MILENTDKWRLDYKGTEYNDKRQGWKMYDKDTGRTKDVQAGDASVVFACKYDAVKKAYWNPNSAWFCHTWNEVLQHLFLEA